MHVKGTVHGFGYGLNKCELLLTLLLYRAEGLTETYSVCCRITKESLYLGC